MNVTVWVAGSWGTALAAVLASSGANVVLWMRDKAQADYINRFHRHPTLLPGVVLGDGVEATVDVAYAAHHGAVLLYVPPSQAMRSLVALTAPYVRDDPLIVHATKGFDGCTRMSTIMAEGLPGIDAQRIVALSGPSHAEEVVMGAPTTVVVAAHDGDAAQRAQEALSTPYLRVYTNDDIVGVELAGALKNMIAIGAGMCDGLGFGDNAKAALVTRGLAEITRLGIAMGAQTSTFTGLAGVGDLIVTCTSRHSRNWRAGYACGQGEKMADVVARMGMVVEGVHTTAAAVQLAATYGVDMPIASQLYRVLFEGFSPQEAVRTLMARVVTHETQRVPIR
ncbi:MAG: NAD(P)-dependent glycerol-3-phosphate dehydrogenase [Paenibacillaceae bacterium]|jgi:glycerol-3-phosphate dehydrogenase (NAD(P)+)|nr:NAD(P)-dependent glycerol-3-phosphate dehydrogenase [Paenibacillaceae bacterium]